MPRIFGVMGDARLAEPMAGVLGGRVYAGPAWALGTSAGASHYGDERTEVVLDGAIYNPEDLEPGASDAERFAHAHRRLGFERALERVHGDFAVALVDRSSGQVWLARDRLGIRPLYYAVVEGGIAFASQPRALLGLPGVDRRPDSRFLAVFAGSHYRHFDNLPECSPYAGVSQLPAATLAELRPGRVRTACYWQLEDLPDEQGSEEDLAQRYRELLTDAVRRRLRHASRPVFTLSGGMDSSSVMACARAIEGRRLPAVSTVYEDPVYDESNEIQSMLAEVVDPWRPVVVGHPDVMDLIDRMVAIHEEPVATATWLAHYLLCAEVKRLGYDALFGGMGGDELNAGEYEHFFFHFADLRASGSEQALRHEVDCWAAHHDHPLYRKSWIVMEQMLAHVVDPARPGACRVNRTRMLRYQAALAPGLFDLAGYEPIQDHVFSSYLKNRTYQDLFRETIPCCLRAEDRHCEAFGLAHFLPFLDARLVAFMYRVPGGLKVRDGVTKVLLRRAMAGVLPEATRTRVKKMGWNAPAHVWFSGRGREPLLDLIHSRAFRERGIYDLREVERLCDEHERTVSSGALEENHMMFLWQLVNLELWLRQLDRG